MRAFIILSLVAFACGQYNYQPGGSAQVSNDISRAFSGAIGGGFTRGIGGGFNGLGSNGRAAGGLIGVGGGFGGFGGNVAAGGLNAGPADAGNGASNLGFTSNAVPASLPQAAINAINDVPSSKESAPSIIYTYTVDEKDFVDPESQRAVESARRPARVVFIEGPQNKGLEDAVLTFANQSVPKTDIYVLSKSTDIGELANKLNNINSNSRNQPEVHFIKYRTAEDAANAQKAIQDQYNSLGGSSNNINGGVAPVINFASQAPDAARSASVPRSSYLPASVFRN